MKNIRTKLGIAAAVAGIPFMVWGYPKLAGAIESSIIPGDSYCTLEVKKNPKAKFEINIVEPTAIYRQDKDGLTTIFPGTNIQYNESGLEFKRTPEENLPYRCKK
ncbi:MAG: hypothetical protein AABX93_01495 [Nanoarchaeota archaeon]